MEILRELDRSERSSLRERLKKHLKDGSRNDLLESHIDLVLNKPHCFKVNIFAKDYDEILICAGHPIATPFQYETLSKSIKYIKAHRDFLDTANSPFLNGQRVEKYWRLLTECHTDFPECFRKLGDCLLHDGVDHSSGRLNITEGMHKLVAYGLAVDMNESFFPIPIYFGTEEASLPNKTD